MSAENQAPEASVHSDAPLSKYTKLLMILAGAALLVSLINTVILLLNPTAGRVAKFNEELKTDLAESIALIHKKIDGLGSAEVEWQAVLKKAREKPDAVYRIVETPDGLLTLTEIQKTPE